jgi:jouberin
MTVEVKSESSQEVYEMTDRPTHFFQREVSSEPLAELIEKPEEPEQSEEAEEGDKGEKQRKIKERREIRPANRRCTIPRRLKAQIPAGERGALALQFNRNGNVLAVAIQELNDYVIQFFDSDGMRKFATVRAHVDLIYELQWSPDDRLLLSASADGMVKVWKGDGKHKLKQTLVHPSYIYSAKFHPQDDRLIVTAGIDRVIRLWDRPREEIMREFAGHETRVNSITFSPDGKNLFSGDADGIIIVWNTDLTERGLDGFTRAKIVREGEIMKVPITHLEMGRSNFSLIVQTRDNMVRVFETKVMVPAQRYSGLVCRRFQMMSTFSPDSQFILGGSEDGSVVLWTTKKGEIVAVKEWNCKFDHPVTAVAWNRVENMVAFSSFGDAQPILVFFDPDTRRNQRTEDIEDW